MARSDVSLRGQCLTAIGGGADIGCALRSHTGDQIKWRAHPESQSQTSRELMAAIRSSLQKEAIADSADRNNRIGVPSRGAEDIGRGWEAIMIARRGLSHQLLLNATSESLGRSYRAPRGQRDFFEVRRSEQNLWAARFSYVGNAT